jgi:hypothetical protein
MGVGVKEGEQGFSTPSTPNTMVALVCARGGNMPADCSQSPINDKMGRDARPRRRRLRRGQGHPGLEETAAFAPLQCDDTGGGAKPKRNWRAIPLFKDISPEDRDFLEAVCNVRLYEGFPSSLSFNTMLKSGGCDCPTALSLA